MKMPVLSSDFPEDHLHYLDIINHNNSCYRDTFALVPLRRVQRYCVSVITESIDCLRQSRIERNRALPVAPRVPRTGVTFPLRSAALSGRHYGAPAPAMIASRMASCNVARKRGNMRFSLVGWTRLPRRITPTRLSGSIQIDVPVKPVCP